MYDRSMRNKWDAYVFKEQMLIDQELEAAKERELDATEKWLDAKEKQLLAKEEELFAIGSRQELETRKWRLSIVMNCLEAGIPIDVVAKVFNLTEQDLKVLQ